MRGDGRRREGGEDERAEYSGSWKWNKVWNLEINLDDVAIHDAVSLLSPIYSYKLKSIVFIMISVL